jgi:hypothetical protein
MAKKYYIVRQGGHSRINGLWVENKVSTVRTLAVALGHGIADGPFDAPVPYGWGEGLYSVDNAGTVECEGANWDSSG